PITTLCPYTTLFRSNLGPAIKYEFGNLSGINSVVYDPPPTNLNLGLNVITTESDYFSIPFMLGISKPFDERDNQMHGQSSFKTRSEEHTSELQSREN